MKKLIVIFLLIVITLFVLTYCFFNRENPYPYTGEYKELYTVAIYSIPDVEGYMHHGEGAFSSDVYIWEQDDYGRTMFSYCEDYGNRTFYLVLCQSYDESNVYFYPDVNYAVMVMESDVCYGVGVEDYLKNTTESFYLENRDKLKEANHWNKPIDKTKCVSYSITDHKDFGKDIEELSTSQCNEILNDYTRTLDLPNPEKYPHRSHKVLQVDAEGNILHEIFGVHQHYDNPNWEKTDPYTYYGIVIWVITDKDGNYDKEKGVMVMYSNPNDANSQFIYEANDVLEFKKKNGWKYNY